MIKRAQGIPYESPVVETIKMMPSQMICGSNESIEPEPEIDWAIVSSSLFDGLL